MPFHRERVIEYLRQGEGAPPPVFVGHGDILKDILTTAKHSASEAKMTRIVQGAPGAGKTSLLNRMQKLWLGTDGEPRVVVLSSTDLLHDPKTGVGAVLDAWTMDRAKWKGTLANRIRRVSGFGAGPGGLSVQFSDERVPGTLREVASAHPTAEHSVPIIVAVDEAQRLDRDKTSPEALFLQTIHDSISGLPLLLVLAGLSDTAEKASGMHLTRGREIHEVPPLTEFQARDLMRRLAMYFGLDTSRHNPQLEALADICDGWPRHLRHAGESLGQAALDLKGAMDRMDWTSIRRETRRRRQDHYRDQRSAAMREARGLVAALMKDIPGPGDGNGANLDRVDVLDLIDLHRDRDGSRSNGWRLPEGMTPRKFLNVLIHQGALYENGDGYIHSPIPSFRSFLIERGGQPDTEPDGRNSDGGGGTDFSA